MLRNVPFWLTAAIWLAVDRATKLWAMQQLKLAASIALWPGVFHLTYVTNTGAAFSLFERTGDWLRWVSLAVTVGLTVLGIAGKRLNRWEQVGYGCILGGAAGNGIDRFAFGYVVDMLDFRLIRFPVFNLADVAINAGLACLAISVLLEARTSSDRPSGS